MVLVSNICRAINDKSTKEVLTMPLRTQLCRKGRLGELVHVATQSDVLVRRYGTHAPPMWYTHACHQRNICFVGLRLLWPARD